mgnify:CR=1 FL=1
MGEIVRNLKGGFWNYPYKIIHPCQVSVSFAKANATMFHCFYSLNNGIYVVLIKPQLIQKMRNYWIILKNILFRLKPIMDLKKKCGYHNLLYNNKRGTFNNIMLNIWIFVIAFLLLFWRIPFKITIIFHCWVKKIRML